MLNFFLVVRVHFKMEISNIILKSNIVVTGVPTKDYRLPTEWVQENTTVVNVSSFKNVDQDALLKIPGVVYVPMVGKVTVAMLERNLVRLFEQFHKQGHPETKEEAVVDYRLHPIHWYTAAAVTALLAMEIFFRQR